MELIAHRGESREGPENTLAAFNLAWESGAKAAECDIHLTQDGEIVVIHDDNTKRTAGRDKLVREQTLAELKTLDAGQWRGPEWAQVQIPTLAEVLATVPGGSWLLIEIKCGTEVIPRLKEVLESSGKRKEQTVIGSFSCETMQAAREAMPDLTMGLISGKRDPEELIPPAKAARLDFLDLQTRPEIDAGFVRRVEASGLKLYVWTVNDVPEARRLAATGVSSLTTDRCQWLGQQLAAVGETG